MANPNDALGTNGAFGGRTSVNAFNDVANFFTAGRVSGWACSPSAGLTVALGGDGTSRDVAIAQDASGNKTTVNNISLTPVLVDLNAAPATNSRIDAIVAYIEDSPQGSGITDNPDVVNLLVVSGTVASSPVIPTDNEIRAAITADGASGATAFYVILASVRISAGTTDIDSTMITQGEWARTSYDHLPSGANTIANRFAGGTFTTTPNTDFTVGTLRIEGIRPGIKYLVCVDVGTFFVNGTLGMLTIQDPATGFAPVGYRRLRTANYQNSVSTTAILNATATTYNFNIQVFSDGTGSNNTIIEGVDLKFIPIGTV